MNNDPSVFMQAFLFTQMGNANKFRKAMLAISENGDDGNQNYIAAFQQYGVIINLIFLQIQPFSSPLDGVPEEAMYVKGFDTYTGALANAVKILPSETFSIGNTLTAPDVVFTFVTIMSALGMAFVVDLQRNHVFEDMAKMLSENRD